MNDPNSSFNFNICLFLSTVTQQAIRLPLEKFLVNFLLFFTYNNTVISRMNFTRLFNVIHTSMVRPFSCITQHILYAEYIAGFISKTHVTFRRTTYNIDEIERRNKTLARIPVSLMSDNYLHISYLWD